MKSDVAMNWPAGRRATARGIGRVAALTVAAAQIAAFFSPSARSAARAGRLKKKRDGECRRFFLRTSIYFPELKR